MRRTSILVPLSPSRRPVSTHAISIPLCSWCQEGGGFAAAGFLGRYLFQARPCLPAAAMTRWWRLRRGSPPGGCRARAGGRAAQGYGATPPASRLLRIACGDGPAGRPGPRRPLRPLRQEIRAGLSLPPPRRGASGDRVSGATDDRDVNQGRALHHGRERPGAELRGRPCGSELIAAGLGEIWPGS
jgi:hypothetical protein